jgi:hypothetical protein
MVHDVFISYPFINKPIADAICAKLEENKVRCWIAPRDILPGEDFAEALFDAIDSSKVFILVFSSKTNNSRNVITEVKRAFDKNIVIIPFRIENILPSKKLEYYIGIPHWLDALTPPLEKHIEELSQTVTIFLQRKNNSITIQSNKIDSKSERISHRNQSYSSDSDNPISIEGIWKGSWNRLNSKIMHEGEICIKQDGRILTADIKIHFKKSGQLTTLTEQLEGSIQNSRVIFHGKLFKYINRGNSTSYLLDNFHLNLNESANEMTGQFLSEKGTGKAHFIKVKINASSSESHTN